MRYSECCHHMGFSSLGAWHWQYQELAELLPTERGSLMVMHSIALPNNALASGVPILELPTNGNPQPLLAEAHAPHQEKTSRILLPFS